MNTLPIFTRREDEIIPESDVLYKAYLVPAKSDLLKLGIDEVLAEKIIYRVIDGGETSVIAAKPIHYALIEICKQAGLDLSPLITLKLDTHGFYLLRLCCTFRSHAGTPHPFVWGEMKAIFSNLTGSEEPLVFDLCPSEVMDTAQIEKEFGLSPSLEFKQIATSAGQIFKKVVEYTELSPVVVSFGKQTSIAGWEYSKSRGRSDIRGNREGFIILMVPKGARVRVTVDVRARVQEDWKARFVSAISRKWRQEDFAAMQEVELPLYRAVPTTEQELRTKRWKEDFGDLIQGRQELSEGEKSVYLY